jgi:hypothetical protein
MHPQDDWMFNQVATTGSSWDAYTKEDTQFLWQGIGEARLFLHRQTAGERKIFE